MRDVRNFIFVLGAAIICAILLTVVWVSNTAVAKPLLLKDVLISPQTIEILGNLSTSSPSKTTFEKIILNYSSNGVRHLSAIDILPYQSFYKKIEEDEGILPQNIPRSVLTLFSSPSFIEMDFFVKKQHIHSFEETLFQRVVFIPNQGWYRVEMHEEGMGNSSSWIYFRNDNIGEILEPLLNKADEK